MTWTTATGASVPDPSTPATGPIRPPGPGPCRSTRPPALSSRTRPTRPISSHSRSTETSTPVSPTPLSRPSKSGSRTSKAVSGRWPPRAVRPLSSLLLTALAGAGDHIVASSALYGGTHTLLDVSLRRLGIDTSFVAPDDPAGFAAAARPTTKAFYTEIVANPSGVVADLEPLAELAHDAGVPLVVDSTLATPYLCRPFEYGADVVVHSATKFIGGHGTSMGGVVVESGRFDWANGRFPRMTEPVPSYGGLRYWDNFGEYGFCTQLRVEQLRDFGACLAPLNAFLLLQGLETLGLRMEAHVANALGLAEHLAAHPAVAWVSYAGLTSSPYHSLATRYLPRGPGAVFAFGIEGGRAAGQSFVESVELASHLANIGDTRTLVIHPASTTHRQLSEDALAAAGVLPDLVRVSVGHRGPG